MDKLWVIQWNMGKVGKLVLWVIIDDFWFELVGVYVYLLDKVGIDVGVFCGWFEIGVCVIDDIDVFVVLGVDSVVYILFIGDVDYVVCLFESGVDVISINLFFYVGGVQGEVCVWFEVVGCKGDSLFYVIGINFGWINVIVIVMIGICCDVELVMLVELVDCLVYELVEIWSFFGMGQFQVL